MRADEQVLHPGHVTPTMIWTIPCVRTVLNSVQMVYEDLVSETTERKMEYKLNASQRI